MKNDPFCFLKLYCRNFQNDVRVDFLVFSLQKSVFRSFQQLPMSNTNFFELSQTIKQILSSMISAIPTTSLLGSYQERDYSQGFQKMMNNVVSKIYKKKGNRQNIFKTLVESTGNEFRLKRESNRCSYLSDLHQRKNSTPFSEYSLAIPKANLTYRHERSKYSLSGSKMMDLGNKTAMKSQKRCQTLPPNDYQESLYQKISEYNTCLMARTYRFQEKDRERIAVRLNETERSEQTQRGSPLATSKIRRCENFKKNNRWVHSKGKFLQTSPISSEQVEFQPWQIDQMDQLDD